MKLALALGLALLATAAQAQDAWTLAADKAAPDVVLSYGDPDARVSLGCPRKTGQITVAFTVEAKLADHQQDGVWVDRIGRPSPWPASVTVASGPDTATVRGQASADAHGSALTAEIATRAPAIAAFRKTGIIALSGLAQTRDLPPAPVRLVRSFLNACG